MNKDNTTQKAYAEHFGNLADPSLSEILIRGFDVWYLQLLPQDKDVKIFDFGCGRGEFLKYLTHRGYTNIYGADINPGFVELCAQIPSAKVEMIDDFDLFISRHHSTFDFLHLKDVAEHIEKDDLIETLGKLSSTLNPGGMIVVSVPQVFGLSSLYSMYDDFTHKTLFTSASLSYVLKASGFFDVKLIQPQIPFSLSPKRLMLRFARYFWFLFIKTAYFLERTGERMPEIFSERLVMTAITPRD